MNLDGEVIPAGRWRVVVLSGLCFLLAAIFAALAWPALGPVLAGQKLGDPRVIFILPAIVGLVVLGIIVLRAGLASMPDATLTDTRIVVGERWAKWTSLGAFVFDPRTRTIAAQVVGRDADPETLTLGSIRLGGRFHLNSDRALVALCAAINERRARAYGWAGRQADPAPPEPTPEPRRGASAVPAGRPDPAGASWLGTTGLNAGMVFALNVFALTFGAALAAALSWTVGVNVDRGMTTCVALVALAAAWLLARHRAGRDRMALVVGSLLYVVAVVRLLPLLPLAAKPGTGLNTSLAIAVPFIIWMAMRRVRNWGLRRRTGFKFG